jgi:hypothetical protein
MKLQAPILIARVPAQPLSPDIPPPEEPDRADLAIGALYEAADTLERMMELQTREMLSNGLAVAQREPLVTANYLDGLEWRNRSDRTVAIYVMVTEPGDLGATVELHGHKIPADVPGGRTDVFTVGMNAGVTITISDPSVKALLVVSDPVVRARHPKTR